jgi:hypothetical protein
VDYRSCVIILQNRADKGGNVNILFFNNLYIFSANFSFFCVLQIKCNVFNIKLGTEII